MRRRRLKELNLLDDFFFSIVSSHRKYGERVDRLILETVYGRRFGELLVIPQKIIAGEDTDQHGIRMDVYLEEKEAADVEDTREENAVNDTLKELHGMVEFVRKEGTAMLGTLRMAERERAWRDEGHRSGLAEGLQRGLQEGREEERKNTEQERKKVEQERRRAQAAEAEVLYLKSLLEKSQK